MFFLLDFSRSISPPCSSFFQLHLILHAIDLNESIQNICNM
jgi:hypothetical protein